MPNKLKTNTRNKLSNLSKRKRKVKIWAINRKYAHEIRTGVKAISRELKGKITDLDKELYPVLKSTFNDALNSRRGDILDILAS